MPGYHPNHYQQAEEPSPLIYTSHLQPPNSSRPGNANYFNTLSSQDSPLWSPWGLPPSLPSTTYVPLPSLDELLVGQPFLNIPSPYPLHSRLSSSPASAHPSLDESWSEASPSSTANSLGASSPHLFADSLSLEGEQRDNSLQLFFGVTTNHEVYTTPAAYSPAPWSMPPLPPHPPPHPGTAQTSSSRHSEPQIPVERLDDRAVYVKAITFRLNGELGISLKEAISHRAIMDGADDIADCFTSSRQLHLKVVWPGYLEHGCYIKVKEGAQVTRAQLASQIGKKVAQFMRDGHKSLQVTDVTAEAHKPWVIGSRGLQLKDISLKYIKRRSDNVWMFKPALLQ